RLEDLDGNVFDRSVIYYDGPPFMGLPKGQATKGLVSRVTRDFPDESRAIPTARSQYSSHGLPVEQRDALGDRAELEYDAETSMFPTRERVEVDSGSVEFQAAYDRGYGAMVSAHDPNGHVRTFELDGLGRLTKAFEPGLTLPVSKFQYTYGTAEFPV